MSYEAWGEPDDSPFEAAMEAGWIDPADLSKATLDVIAERDRQHNEEKFTPEWDDRYVGFELVKAAVCYAQAASWKETTRRANRARAYPPGGWPWADHWWKPAAVDDRRRDLVKAGALILAEIERLDRAEAPKPALAEIDMHLRKSV